MILPYVILAYHTVSQPHWCSAISVILTPGTGATAYGIQCFNPAGVFFTPGIGIGVACGILCFNPPGAILTSGTGVACGILCFNLLVLFCTWHWHWCCLWHNSSLISAVHR